MNRFALLQRMAALALTLLVVHGCKQAPQEEQRGAAAATTKPLRVVCTTGMLGDAAEQIGGHAVQVTSLMGAGVDPHLYKARPSDMQLLAEADLIVYHGLHLEAKLADVLEKVGQTRPVVAAAEEISEADLISPPGSGGAHDPHVWFDILLWKQVCGRIAEELGEALPEQKADIDLRLEAYMAQLDKLHEYVQQRAAEVPEEQRVLVTAHDAFNYFGQRYGFEVVGLQGISTEAEAGTGDVQQLARFIAERKLPAIFVESSVPVRNIEALVAAAKAQGHRVAIGGSLYSDAMGDKGTPEGTYSGMVRHNIDTIVKALAPASARAGAADGN